MIIGVNFMKDMFVVVCDIVGGWVGVYEKILCIVCEMVFEEMVVEVIWLGVNVIVGIDIDYEVLGEKNGMLMVVVSGIVVIFVL